MIKNTVSHNFEDESMIAKARWFQSLSLQERMDLLCFFTDLIVQNNPQILEKKKHVKPTWGRFQILTPISG